MSEQEPVQGYYRQEPPKPPKKVHYHYALDRFLGLLFAVFAVMAGIVICLVGLTGPDGPSPFRGLELVVGIVIIAMAFLYSYASRSRQWAFIVIFALSILGFIVGVSQRTLTFTKWNDYVGLIWLVYSPLRLFRVIGPPLLKAGE